jgi:hypothetical protein
MRTQLITSLLSVLLLSACSSTKEKTADALTGNWLILYPDHKLTSYHQRDVYGRHQDSLLGLYGLKLIRLEEGGRFVDVDSASPNNAKWQLREGVLKVQEGGRGFNPFNSSFTDLENDTLKLTQVLPLEDEEVTVVWHLKKIDEERKEAALFGAEANRWRTRPTAPESPAAIQKRLANILDFYGDYFQLISRESIYFSYVRVPLPFRYYQHAIGLHPQLRADFVRLFFNEENAAAAHRLLGQAIDANSFNRGGNFAAEYGAYLKKLARWMSKK